MNLIKDKYLVSEIAVAEKEIKKALIDYIEENNYNVITTNYRSNVLTITPSPPSQYTVHVKNYRQVINNEMKIFNEDNSTTHKINAFNSTHFLKYMLENLSKKSKIIFIKTISNHPDNYPTLDTINGDLIIEDFWLYLRNWNQFSKSSKQTHVFKTIIKGLENKSIDTEEKTQALYQFLHFYKPIAKRTDTKNVVLRLINDKVEPKYHQDFSKLLNIEIKETEDKGEYLKSSKQLIVINVDKEKLFEQLRVKNYPQADVTVYNTIFTTVNDTITEKLKVETGVECINYVELCSKNTPAKVYIESNKDGFKCDIEKTYENLIKVAAANIAPKNKSSLKEGLVDAYLYFKIQNELSSNNDNLNEIKPKKIKI